MKTGGDVYYFHPKGLAYIMVCAFFPVTAHLDGNLFLDQDSNGVVLQNKENYLFYVVKAFCAYDNPWMVILDDTVVD